MKILLSFGLIIVALFSMATTNSKAVPVRLPLGNGWIVTGPQSGTTTNTD